MTDPKIPPTAELEAAATITATIALVALLVGVVFFAFRGVPVVLTAGWNATVSALNFGPFTFLLSVSSALVAFWLVAGYLGGGREP